MKDVFAQLDDALIDRLFQPLADALDRHLALGINRAARTAIDLASLAWILAQASAAAHALAVRDMRSAAALGFLLVIGLSAFTTLRGVFQRGDSEAGARKTAQANPLRPAMLAHRATCLAWMIGLAVRTVLVPTDFAALALVAVGVFATAAVYIGACSNPPPRWRESGAFDRDLAFGGA